MIKDVVIALLTVKINEFAYVVGDVLNKRVVINELSGILDYVSDIPEEKYPIVVSSFNEGNCKCEIYEQALEEVLSNLRSIDSPNPADSYIDESIEIVKKVCGGKVDGKN